MSMWVCVSRQQSVILRQASALGEIHTDAYVNTSTTAGRLPGRRSPALIWVGFKRYPRIAQLLGKLKLLCCGSYGNWAPTIVVYIKYGIIALWITLCTEMLSYGIYLLFLLWHTYEVLYPILFSKCCHVVSLNDLLCVASSCPGDTLAILVTGFRRNWQA